MFHPAQLPIDDLLAACNFQRTRRSGPGGQHRNKVETAVVVEYLPTGLRAEANERRSQEQNRQMALHRLRVKLALEVRTPPLAEVSELWRSRTTGGKLAINSEHDDFPALLSEALDMIADAEFEIAAAAPRLGVSSSQLVRLLKLEPAVIASVNRERRLRGKTGYR
jgi:hypothetical protein